MELPELMEIIPGPDFPTGGIILGRSGIYSAYSTGRGSIVMRGKVAIEAMRGEREAIIITEVPFQVNKATMIEKMAELVRDKRIEGISDIRDESDRQGYRVVIELKRDANCRRHPQPALPLHAAADLVRRQYGGAERRQAGSADADRHADGLHRVPRGGRQPAHEIPAAQGARPRPCAGRPGDRRRQYRRGDQADPQRAGSADGARAVDGARAGRRPTSRR